MATDEVTKVSVDQVRQDLRGFIDGLSPDDYHISTDMIVSRMKPVMDGLDALCGDPPRDLRQEAKDEALRVQELHAAFDQSERYLRREINAVYKQFGKALMLFHACANSVDDADERIRMYDAIHELVGVRDKHGATMVCLTEMEEKLSEMNLAMLKWPEMVRKVFDEGGDGQE